MDVAEADAQGTESADARMTGAAGVRSNRPPVNLVGARGAGVSPRARGPPTIWSATPADRSPHDVARAIGCPAKTRPSGANRNALRAASGHAGGGGLAAFELRIAGLERGR